MERKYGFITGQDGTDYFFHRDYLENPNIFPKEGDAVRFQPASTDRGLIASHVVISYNEHGQEGDDRSAAPTGGDARQGNIASVVAEKGYCFLQDEHGFTCFAHVSDFREPNMMNVFFEQKALLEFTVETESDGRLRARNIRNVGQADDVLEPTLNTKYIGTVTRKDPTFGFARNESVGDIFFHQSEFVDVSEWDICFVGSDIEYEVRHSDQDERISAVNIKLTSKI